MKKKIFMMTYMVVVIMTLIGCGQVNSEDIKAKLTQANDLKSVLTYGNLTIESDYLSEDAVATSARTVYSIQNGVISCVRTYDDGFGFYWDGTTEYDYNSSNDDSYDYAYTYVNGMETEYNEYISGDLFKAAYNAEITACEKNSEGYTITMEYAYDNGSATRYIYETDREYHIQSYRMGIVDAEEKVTWQTNVKITYQSTDMAEKPETEFDDTNLVTLIILNTDGERKMQVEVPDNFEFNIVAGDNDVFSYEREATKIYTPVQITEDITIYVIDTQTQTVE